MPKRIMQARKEQILGVYMKHPELSYKMLAQQFHHDEKTIAAIIKEWHNGHRDRVEDLVIDFLPDAESVVQLEAARMAVRALLEGEQWAIKLFLTTPRMKAKTTVEAGEEDPLMSAFG